MQATRRLRGLDDRSVERWIRVFALVLVIGVPLIAVVYWLDRHVDAGLAPEARAVAQAEAALRAAPNDLGVRNHLAAAYVTAGRVEEGIAQFGEVLGAAPGDRAALLGRGLAYISLGEMDQARADFEAFVATYVTGDVTAGDAQLEQAYFQLGSIALEQGRATDAATHFTAALRLDRSDADALYGLGRALIASGDATKGVAALRRAVAFVPTGWCEPYAAMADGYGALANAEGVAYASGMVAFCHGDLDTATTQLRALVASPFATDALVGLAYVAARQGDREAAASLFQQVLTADPANASAAIGLQALGVPDAHASVPALQPAGTP